MLLVFGVSISAHSANLFCTEVGSTSIDFENKSLKISGFEKPEKASQFSISDYTSNKPTIVGNAGNAKMAKIGDGRFVETTPSGNVNFYSWFSTKKHRRGINKEAGFLYVHKAYRPDDLDMPYTITTIYKCDAGF